MPGNDPITPFFDTLIEATHVPDFFSLQLCDVYVNTSGLYNRPGQMTIGGLNGSLSTGARYLTPITEELYYGISVTGITVNSTRLDYDCGELNTPGPSIVDSGTTHMIVPPSIHTDITKKMPLNFSTPEKANRFYTG
jgi:hypothetical protein